MDRCHPMFRFAVRRASVGLCVAVAFVAALAGCSDDETDPKASGSQGSVSSSGVGASGGDGGTGAVGASGGTGGSGGTGVGGAGGGPTPGSGCLAGGSDLVTWSCRLGQDGSEIAYEVALDSAGDLLFSGQGALFAGLPAAPPGGTVLALGKKAPDGSSLWSKHFVCSDGTGDDFSTIDTDGTEVLMAGSCAGDIDFGAGAPAGTGDIVLARFDGAGAVIWSKRLGGAAGSSVVDEGRGVTDVAIDAQGRIALAVTGVGAMDFGDGSIQATATDGYLVVLDADGQLLYAKQIGGAGTQELFSVVASADGFVISGAFAGTIDLGGASLTSAGERDLFVAKFDKLGEHVWSKRFGSASDESVARLAVDQSGNVWMTGRLQAAVDFGGGALNTAGPTETFLAELDASGQHVFSARYSESRARGIAVDTQGFVTIVGQSAGMPDFGGGQLGPSAGAFVARFDTLGDARDSHVFDQGAGFATAVGLDGTSYVVGNFEGSVDFGNGAHQAVGGSDAFVMALVQ